MEQHDKHLYDLYKNEKINDESLEDVLFPQMIKLTNGKVVVSWFDNPTSGNSRNVPMVPIDR